MRKRCQIAAWLSLFAMLMIFVGPLISQGLNLAHGKSSPISMAGMACDDMPGTSQMSHHASADNHNDLIIWEKCGYCSLLFQHPLITESNLLNFCLRVPPTLFLPRHFTAQLATPPVFPGARSRAPPVRPLNITSTFC
ncbi:DUF2946 domain-containing protein [Pseudomonas sp. G.S.17]|uniref:DUF2946 domain-containing protein n=1 Tax=Pseudomonas sp. G.S.17 TaxID=3137451 RepID=UPI00311CB0B8